ncbi:MAG TPA: EthD domain-containing protein [Caulobacteraceae bacterium]|jgi:uncharacterized protein (TIGR02118 family)|nr:EthD domain-containing protein [Caulobacteraceae bacterium]
MIKIISLLRRKDGMTHEAFVRHWEHVHAPMLRNLPEVRRYVQSHIVTERPTPLGAIDGEIDGIVELWFDDLEAFERSWRSPANKAVVEDSHTFIGAIKSFIVDEKTIISAA